MNIRQNSTTNNKAFLQESISTLELILAVFFARETKTSEYDEETGGGDYYAGGVLEITWDAETGQPWLNGYDGCFELPDYIVAKLVENGVKDNL